MKISKIFTILFFCRAMVISYFTIESVNAQELSQKHKKQYFPSAITFTNNFSASYVQYKNWKYSGYNNYSFLLRSNVNYDSLGNNWETHIRFNGELGYMKFVDSTWFKNTDFVDLGADVVKSNGKKFQNVLSFYVSTQFLSTYEMFCNDSGYYSKRWVAGFGNPMNIDLGYGTTVRFWKTCRINLTFVTLRTTTLPVTDPEQKISGNDMIYKNTLISSEYGLGIQTFIRKSIGSRVRWENYSRAFANAVNREKFDLDFRNRVIVKIFKYLDFIVDSRVKYSPFPPYKFQFRNELMLSFTFEKV